MKTEKEIARRNLKNYKLFPNDNTLLCCQEHKHACQRFLEFLDNINVFKGSKHPIDRGVHKITEEKIQDLKTAIKLYEKKEYEN